MTIQFDVLCSLRVEHEYRNGIYPELEFVIPSTVSQELARGRLLVKVTDGTLRVLFQANELGEPLVRIPGRTIRIGLKPQAPEFYNVTQLALAGGSTTALYRNHGAADALDATITPIRLIGAQLVHPLASAQRPVTLTLTDAAGHVVSAEQIEQAEQTSFAYRPGSLPAGAYSIAEQQGSTTRTSLYLVDPELQQQGVFAVVELTIDDSFYGAPPTFVLPLQARAQSLKYYVVAKKYSSGDVGQLKVEDLGYTGDGRDQLSFEKVLPPFASDDLSDKLLEAPGVQLVLFKSQPVPRRERGRQRIQLSRGTEVLIPHLPQPGASSTGADIVVHVSKP